MAMRMKTDHKSNSYPRLEKNSYPLRLSATPSLDCRRLPRPTVSDTLARLSQAPSLDCLGATKATV